MILRATISLFARLPNRWALGATLTSLLLLIGQGCVVGPRYARPELPTTLPAGYKENSEGTEEARANGWRPANPQDHLLRGKWWEVFKDPELNALEEKLNVDNQNVKVYINNYIAALAVVRQARAGLYPTVSVTPNATVQGSHRDNTVTASSTSTTGSQGSISNSGSTVVASRSDRNYSLPFSASWEPDLFGKLRNTVLEDVNAAQVSAANLQNEILSEQASLAQIYFELRGQDALQALYDRTVSSYRDSLKVTQSLLRNGVYTEQDVAQAEVNLRNAEANASSVAATRAQYEHAIALLTGQVAGNFAMPVRPLDAKPPSVPVGVPSELLERRPDIAAAERGMAELNARIGVGESAYYPDVSITAGAGFQSSHLSNLLSISNGFWSLGSSVAEKIFTFGARRALVDQYKAEYWANVATYRQTVLNAFKEVEDYLVASRQLAEQAHRQELAAQAAERYLKIATARYKTGVDTYLNVITAQNSLLGSQQTLVTLQTNRMTSAVQLIAALGGGWQSSELPSESTVRENDDEKVGASNPF